MAEQHVMLRWEGAGLRFRGGAVGGPEMQVDGDGETAVSPVQQLAVALAGCMGSDIVDIMNKSRAPLGGLEVHVEGARAPQPPRRYTQLHVRLVASGVSDADVPKLERALELSRTTYCSVLHTLRPDAEVTFAIERR